MALQLESESAEALPEGIAPAETQEAPSELVQGVNKEQLERAAALLREQSLPEKVEPPKAEKKADRVEALEAQLEELRSQLTADRSSAQRQSTLNRVKNSGEYRAINAYGEEAMNAVHQVMEDAAKTGGSKTWQEAATEVEKYLLDRFKSVATVLNGPPTLTNSQSAASRQVDYSSMPKDEAYAEFAKNWAKAL